MEFGLVQRGKMSSRGGGGEGEEVGGLEEEQEEEGEECTPAGNSGSTMDGLLDTAARMLVEGGKLVYLHPSTRAMTLASLPTHPLLSLQSICEERLGPVLSRLVVVMKRVGGPYYTSKAASYLKAQRQASISASLALRKLVQLPWGGQTSAGLHDKRLVMGEEGGLQVIKKALYEAWFHKQRGNKEAIEEGLKIYKERKALKKAERDGKGIESGDTSTLQGGSAATDDAAAVAQDVTVENSDANILLPRRRELKLQKRRLQRQEYRLVRIERTAAAQEAEKAERLNRKAAAAAFAGECGGAANSPPPPTQTVVTREGPSRGQKRAARKAAAEADLAAGKHVMIGTVAFDNIFYTKG